MWGSTHMTAHGRWHDAPASEGRAAPAPNLPSGLAGTAYSAATDLAAVPRLRRFVEAWPWPLPLDIPEDSGREHQEDRADLKDKAILGKIQVNVVTTTPPRVLDAGWHGRRQVKIAWHSRAGHSFLFQPPSMPVGCDT